MPTPESLPEAQRGKIQQRYGFDPNNSVEFHRKLRIAIGCLWFKVAVTTFLLLEGLYGSFIDPYRPAAYLAWVVIGLGIFAIVAYRLMEAYDKTSEPNRYSRRLMEFRISPKYPNWAVFLARLNAVAFVLVAFGTGRPYLALAMALLVITIVVNKWFEEKSAWEELARITPEEEH